LAAGGEVDLVAAAVGRAAAPLDVPLAFEAVQDGDDPARHDAELLAHRLLADARVAADQAQHTRVGGGDPERGERPLEGGGGVGAELGEEEGDATGAATVHAGILAHLLNYSCHVLSTV